MIELFICTAENPWDSKYKGRVQHPDAKHISDEKDDTF